MRKAICEITGKEFDCKNCKSVEGKYCAYWELDDAVSHLAKQIREYVMEALPKNETK
jgi:hypothetical protein